MVLYCSLLNELRTEASVNMFLIDMVTWAVSGAILRPAATPLWKFGHTVMSGGVSI